jgi:hypothetical protein
MATVRYRQAALAYVVGVRLCPDVSIDQQAATKRHEKDSYTSTRQECLLAPL